MSPDAFPMASARAARSLADLQSCCTAAWARWHNMTGVFTGSQTHRFMAVTERKHTYIHTYAHTCPQINLSSLRQSLRGRIDDQAEETRDLTWASDMLSSANSTMISLTNYRVASGHSSRRQQLSLLLTDGIPVFHVLSSCLWPGLGCVAECLTYVVICQVVECQPRGCGIDLQNTCVIVLDMSSQLVTLMRR